MSSAVNFTDWEEAPVSLTASEKPSKAPKKAVRALKNVILGADHDGNILWSNEVAANFMVSRMCVMTSVLLVVTKILNVVGIFNFNAQSFDLLVVESIAGLMVPALLCYCFKGQKAYLKYLFLLVITFTFARLDWLMGFNVVLVICIPVVISCRYFSTQLTVFTGVATMVSFLISTINRASGYLDMNFIFFPEGISIVVPEGGDIENAAEVATLGYYKVFDSLILHQYLPKMLPYSIVLTVCILITRQCQSMLVSQAKVSEEHARIDTELNLATSIQANMLPRNFPAYPGQDDFDVFATMHPAKEVGGDFYDFFMVDDRRLGFVIADVSGKGVPAALFMATAKNMIKSHAQMGLSPAQVFSKTNNLLCEGNEAELFITGWMGYLDLQTGVVTYVNAGHNPPVLRHANGQLAFLKSKPDLVLAAMEDFEYHQNTVTLIPGDRLFLYTDGVTEATTADNRLYGDDALLAYLETNGGEPLTQLLGGLWQTLCDFVGTAPQFDDITMLAVDLKKLQGTEEEQS